MVRFWMRRMILALLLGLPAAAPAETRCEPRPIEAKALRGGLDLALKTREALQRSGASVALLARAGQDVSRHGLRYTHMGIVSRDAVSGHWQVTHLLNECGTAHSSLYQEGLGNFFMDDLYAFETLMVIPGEDMQRMLQEALKAGLHVSLHNAAYSTIAYPFSTRYQNCNQWVLELVAAVAATPGTVQDRASAQQWLSRSAYRPTQIRIPAGQRLGARLFAANVRFDDHPPGAIGRYEVVSVESVVSFLRDARLTTGEEVLVLGEP
ncbi:MAG: DUF2145 domain-containing protein [Burkholderiales bacterium]|nr:DUF2145 domain-containing protein [Burkholderiales bacterium]